MTRNNVFPLFGLQGRIKSHSTSTEFRGHYWKLWTMGELLIYQQNSWIWQMISFFSWQNALKTYMPNVWRKPQKANITEGVLKLQFWDIYPLLGAANTTIHSWAGSYQHLACSVQCMFWSAVCRSVTAQCGELQPWSQRKCSGDGGGRAACSTTSFSTPS